ncbi:hypothetical protein, partial [Enterococcus faecium]
SASNNKNSQTKIAPPIFVWLDLFPQMQAFEHRLYQEVVSLPFSSESQGAISKNSFSCLLNIVTCDRGVGRRTPFK